MKELEQQWVEKFQRGDPEGFEAVFRVYGDSVFRICYRLSGCRAEAEDLAQETFVAAFRSRQKFEGRSALGTWLYRLALDCCRREIRRSAPRTMPILVDVPTNDPRMTATADAISLEEALLQLPHNLRESLLLVKVEGLKYREAAAVLGVPTGTVQYWVFEGLIRMRTLMPGFESGESY
ncbi:RNA polymerase sigma factor [Fimbriimonas ginsengisoli]|uniref:RNA polymerase, sigma-24 subunit, ECF subfamily n=1 Tax=Fimbriimonas ginsengisoli Gsoil 348 TaxID=661478 RepID=A0A068NKS3_FIMGI|nr:RNA polymerase sigma factor [Fimbriimonas ginsengisoli]AIE84051.1 RNA polymerase, sigma-24 subunit, ECF subfamily [Fimbriimonas ginsengisoli Gsoil 348]